MNDTIPGVAPRIARGFAAVNFAALAGRVARDHGEILGASWAAAGLLVLLVFIGWPDQTGTVVNITVNDPQGASNAP